MNRNLSIKSAPLQESAEEKVELKSRTIRNIPQTVFDAHKNAKNGGRIAGSFNDFAVQVLIEAAEKL